MAHHNTAECDQFARQCDALIAPSKVRVELDIGSKDALVALRLKDHYANAVVFAFNVTHRLSSCAGVTLAAGKI
jgi:hypothetical protein